MGFGADHESGEDRGTIRCLKCGESRPYTEATALNHICRDPLKELAQAILDGRVYFDGGPWEDRDGNTHWQMTIKVESDD